VANRIKEIKIKHFRSFYGEHTIDLENSGKCLFIYGENGSGKSSVCKALNNFFEAADHRKKSLGISNFEFRHLEPSEKGNAQISLKLTNNEELIFKHNGHVGLDDLIQQARRLKGFLEYKNLLPIYFNEGKERINLFRFLVEGPLNKLRNPKTNKQISSEWSSDKKTKLSRDFYEGVFQIAIELQKEINNILSYFDKSLLST
jgi:predicted ATP-dependent endonuclease of OLD family